MFGACTARKGFLGYLREHKFEPRYDTLAPTFTPQLQLSTFSAEEVKAILQVFVKQVYVGDVCQYCGEHLYREG